MFKNSIIFALFLSTVYANGEITILHHPDSLVFKGHESLKESTLPEVYTAAFGFSTEKYSNWNGMFIEDPLNLPEAVVTIAVDGTADTNLGKGHHFPLKTDEGELNVFETLERRVNERYPEGGSHLIRIDLTEGLAEVQKYDVFENIKDDKVKKSLHKFLKSDVEEHREFLKEISLLSAIASQVEENVKSDYIPDIFWFRIGSLHALIDIYGENSTEVKEAKGLLNNVIVHLNSVFNKVYGGRVLVSVVVSDSIHTRRARNILAAGDDATDKFASLNLAKHYSKDFPVIFNIILWFGIAMVFAILAICIAIGTMDPGRDSIIYRMTSTRMKKD